jgi:hypothetical protein
LAIAFGYLSFKTIKSRLIDVLTDDSISVLNLSNIRHAILGLNVFVRIVEVTCVRDKDNVIVSQDVVLGDFKRSDRYRKRVSEAASAVGGLGGKSNFVKNYRNIIN